jgi:hypothetical protein
MDKNFALLDDANNQETIFCFQKIRNFMNAQPQIYTRENLDQITDIGAFRELVLVLSEENYILRKSLINFKINEYSL